MGHDPGFGGAASRRCLSGCGHPLLDTANVYSAGKAEEVLGTAIAGRRDKVLISTKGTFPTGPGPNDSGSSRQALHRRRRGESPPPGHRLHRHLLHARVRRDHPGVRDAECAGRPDTQRQDSLHRLLELLGLASDEVSLHLRALWWPRYVAHQAYYSLARASSSGSSCRWRSIRTWARWSGALWAGARSPGKCGAARPHRARAAPRRISWQALAPTSCMYGDRRAR